MRTLLCIILFVHASTSSAEVGREEQLKAFERTCNETEDPNACLSAGISYEKMGKLEQAKSFYEKTCVNLREPVRAFACNQLGLMQTKAKDFKTAISTFEQACELGSNDGCHNKGEAVALSGDIVLAVEIFKESCSHGLTRSCDRPETLSKLMADFCPQGSQFQSDQESQDGNRIWLCKKDGMLDGKVTEWYPDLNHEKSISEYKDGKNTGRYLAFYPSGNKQIDGFLRDGKKVGTWSEWTDSGKTIKLETEKERFAAIQKQKETDRANEQAAKIKEQRLEYCSCLEYKKILTSNLEREKKIGKRTGFVDKSKMHSIGEGLELVDEYFAHLNVKNRIPASSTSCTSVLKGHDVYSFMGNCSHALGKNLSAQ